MVPRSSASLGSRSRPNFLVFGAKPASKGGSQSREQYSGRKKSTGVRNRSKTEVKSGDGRIRTPDLMHMQIPMRSKRATNCATSPF